MMPVSNAVDGIVGNEFYLANVVRCTARSGFNHFQVPSLQDATPRLRLKH